MLIQESTGTDASRAQEPSLMGEHDILRAVVVGLGPHGKRLVQAIDQANGIKLFAMVDRCESALRESSVGTSITRSTELAEVLNEGHFDLACIATNGPSHAELATQCMRAGVSHVMVEKPFACSLREAQVMIDAANETGARLAVDHPRRYSPCYKHVQQGIASGRWGQIRSVYIQRPGIGLGCLGTHSFDLASFLIGRPVKAVVAWIDSPVKRNPRGGEYRDPGGTVVLDYGGGIRAMICQLEDGAGPMSVEVNLSGARIRIDEKMDVIEIVERDLAIKKTPKRNAAYERIVNPDGLGGKRVLVDEITLLLEDLVNSDSPQASAESGYDSVEVLVAAYLSHEQRNCPVKLPLASVHHSKWLPVT